ncbi:MAG: alanine racemase [Chloracidobacterium sp.]|nr:alanine racemase [Chloracidobacterium sp.]
MSSWQIEHFLTVKDNRLHIDGVDVVELAREHGTPLFAFSESRIRHNIDRLKKVADVIDCPLKLCYAAKAMSTMGILRAVKDAGCDIEVNSGGELWKALKAGFTGEQINFNGNSKEVWELELAITNEIYAIQVDSLYELSLILETAIRLEKPANVSLRMVPEIESGTHSGLQTAMLTSKFGMMPDEAFRAFRVYADSPHLNLNGIHLHVGSQNPDPQVYSAALVKLFDAMLQIFNETGVKLKHINLGGGFPVNYSRGSEPPIPPEMPEFANKIKKSFEEAVKLGYIEHDRGDGTVMRAPLPREWVEIAARKSMLSAGYEPDSAIAEAWKQVRENAEAAGMEHLLSDLTVLLEPGRSIIADAGICLTTVRNAKERPLSDINSLMEDAMKIHRRRDEEKPQQSGARVSFGIYSIQRGFVDPAITAEHWLLTDAGFNILLSMETYKWYYHLISAERAGEPHDFPYKVAGPLCDGGDVYFDHEGHGRLPEHRFLPREIRPGEVLALLNCGAYSLAQGMQYNGRFLPPVILIRENGAAELIRKREGFEDLIASDVNIKD